MIANDRSTEDGTDEELAGLYTADTKTGVSVYPRSTAEVHIAPAVNGYHDITCFDADGNVVAEQNRPTHRVRAAIEDDRGDGYSMVVSEAPRDVEGRYEAFHGDGDHRYAESTEHVVVRHGSGDWYELTCFDADGALVDEDTVHLELVRESIGVGGKGYDLTAEDPAVEAADGR